MPLPARFHDQLRDATRVHIVMTGVKSRSHLLHISALIRTILATEHIIGVRVTLRPQSAFLHAQAVGVSDVRQLLPDDARIQVEDASASAHPWTFEPDAVALYVSVGAPGLKAWTQLKRANGARRFITVVTDEGIGTYGGVRQRTSAQQRQGVKAPTAFAKSFVIAGAARVLTDVRWTGYIHTEQGWQLRPEFADELRLQMQAASYDNAYGDMSQCAIIVTQPFADMGVISSDDQVKYVQALADAARKAGLRPLVRPHPAEDRNRYDEFDVMDGLGAIELDPRVQQASLVLGGPSTGLVNLAGVSAVPVLWVSIPGLEYLDTNISRAQREIFTSFLGAPVNVRDVASRLP